MIMTLFSCKKSNDEPKSKPVLLSSGLWKISSIGVDLDKNNTVDLPYPLENCEKDNTLEFKSDGTGISYEGATKCDPEDPDTENFTWALKNNETILSIAIPGSFFSGETTLITLNSTTLEAYLDYTDPSTGTELRIVFKLIH
ncbi:lipocalin family protein [Flavihumibacter sp. CACIAM 22H1]|uniref:lipocalin family protein n=1 Tax=Flavihumibacter sp. CACIAM 22H1 TaxID=1812911 RepID=UPI0025B9E4CF|nr:lipocalin family protein [Flavihumibacter sp. CACIAM 22H1]